MKTVLVAFRMTPEQVEQLDARAEAFGMNRSQYILQVLRREIAAPADSLQIIAEKKTQYRAPGTTRKLHV